MKLRASARTLSPAMAAPSSRRASLIRLSGFGPFANQTLLHEPVAHLNNLSERQIQAAANIVVKEWISSGRPEKGKDFAAGLIGRDSADLNRYFKWECGIGRWSWRHRKGFVRPRNLAPWHIAQQHPRQSVVSSDENRLDSRIGRSESLSYVKDNCLPLG